MYCSTFAAMETAVRSGNSPYQSNIINFYIVAGLDRAKAMNNIEDTKSVHLRIYNTLLNTMCDTFIPLNWREKCHVFLVKMMPLLNAIYCPKEFNRHKDELNILHQYFCAPPLHKIKTCYTFEIKNAQS
ncbi:hypothetical protein WNY51_18480 [Pseudocolwellia sp. AS88]|uniref:hypothetical protein n=1 Tax=Pseudocolwellia sp. AS88 TaxID=3063958 RepID=UPI0026F1843A|nr:hypothetical protein [Pseudocolwellia sp. AS88]MDO7086538.1 hypothetical protein [Pseudocolwellia sp. AS88]